MRLLLRCVIATCVCLSRDSRVGAEQPGVAGKDSRPVKNTSRRSASSCSTTRFMGRSSTTSSTSRSARDHST